MAYTNGNHTPDSCSTSYESYHEKSSSQVNIIDALIVGTGPAGASLACFLASHSITGVIISDAPTEAKDPRAHITNVATMECLRDIGIEDQCMKLATYGNTTSHTRWSYSLAGREYGRIYSWGNDPKRRGEYETASPCREVDLPQMLLEPVLTRYATLHGFRCKFDTEFLSFEEQEDGTIVSALRDKFLNHVYHVRSRYLFGGDGGRSKVVEQLGIPLIQKPGGGLAVNVLVKADLSHLMEHRQGSLHWLIQPDVEHPKWASISVARMVRPWTEWMFVLFSAPDADPEIRPTPDEFAREIRLLIGDDTPFEITGVIRWHIHDVVAKYYSRNNIFCLGDAVHRHPPTNGLGLNTCIQDAFNLAWKIAYVEKGLADRSLLGTYTIERQPVGLSVVTQANASLRLHMRVWELLGNTRTTMAERTATMNELRENSEAGRIRRRALEDAVRQLEYEFHALGLQIGQHYQSTAVCEEDEDSSKDDVAGMVDDPVLHYIPSTYPGRRLPHVWLGKSIPSGFVSTIDLAGHGAFTLFTGIGGSAIWRGATVLVRKQLGVDIMVHGIGFDEEYEDPYFEWARVRGVDDSGCVLVRPDRFVAWRAKEVVDGDEELVPRKLLEVMRKILGRV